MTTPTPDALKLSSPSHGRRIALVTSSFPNAIAISDISWEPHDQLVVGREHGLDEASVAACDSFATIPQYGHVGSLNMVCALAIGAHAMTARGLPSSLGLDNVNISLLWCHTHGDPSLGPIVRNADAFGVHTVFVVGRRRRYNRRGTMGGHRHTTVAHVDSVSGVDGAGMAWWALEAPHAILHPIEQASPLNLYSDLPRVYLDDREGVRRAIPASGVMLCVAEEGHYHDPSVLARCTALVCVGTRGGVSPYSRGLGPVLATAIALHAMREA